MVNWLTAFIALIVALISALQWITARQKVVLDLFDKRFAVYEELCDSIVIRDIHDIHGIHKPAVENLLKFTLAANRAQFLFGPEVMIFLEARNSDLAFLFVMDNPKVETQIPQDVELQAAEQNEYIARLNHVTRFLKDFDVLVAPYMKHTQKRFPIPYIDA